MFLAQETGAGNYDKRQNGGHGQNWRQRSQLPMQRVINHSQGFQQTRQGDDTALIRELDRQREENRRAAQARVQAQRAADMQQIQPVPSPFPTGNQVVARQLNFNN